MPNQQLITAAQRVLDCWDHRVGIGDAGRAMGQLREAVKAAKAKPGPTEGFAFHPSLNEPSDQAKRIASHANEFDDALEFVKSKGWA